jgi:hypothetical protein
MKEIYLLMNFNTDTFVRSCVLHMGRMVIFIVNTVLYLLFMSTETVVQNTEMYWLVFILCVREVPDLNLSFWVVYSEGFMDFTHLFNKFLHSTHSYKFPSHIHLVALHFLTLVVHDCLLLIIILCHFHQSGSL